MTLDSLPDLDTSGLCLVKTLSTALTCWPYRNTALRDGARTSTHNSSVANLVRVHAGGNRDLGELARPRRIAHVHDRRPVRRGDVGDVRDLTTNDDLTTARTVEVADLLDAVGVAHSSSPEAEDGRPHRPRAQ